MSKLYSTIYLLLVCFIIASCNAGQSGKNNPEKSVSAAEDEQDGMEAYMQYLFKRTKDPALNYVPYERLEFAKNEAIRRSAFQNRTNSDLIWTERGPNNIGGRTRALLVDKNDATGNTVFAGSVGGGIWKCTDFKSSNYNWTKVNDNMENLAIGSLAQDPANPLVMYAGTGEGFYNVDAIRGGGIFKSTDGGATWSVLSSTIPSAANYNFYYVQKIVVNTNGDVYASTRGASSSYGGVFKSTDGGNSWARVLGTVIGGLNYYSRGNDLELSSNGDLYATTGLQGTSVGSYGRVFKSAASLGAIQGDAGQWTEITPTPPTGESGFRRIELAVAPSSPQTLYVLCQKFNASSVTKFYKSTNGGTSWTAISVPSWCDQGSFTSDFTRGQAWYDLIATFDPNDPSKLFIGGVDVMKSTNGGTSFTQATRWSNSSCGSMPIIHADIHNIIYMNGSSNDMIVSNDGGVYYSSDGGTTFSNRNSNYNVTQYYAVALHPNAGSNYMLAGAQDNGSHKFGNAGINAVTYATGGDGAFCFIDQIDPTYQITSYVYSNYRVSRNSGASFTNTTNDSNGDFINPCDYDSRSKILYCGYTAGTYGRMTNIASGTLSIGSVSVSALGTLYATAFKVDPNTLNRLYIGADNSGSGSTVNVIRVDNANGTPSATNISIPGGTGNVSSIDVEDGDPNHLLVTFSNFGVSSVFESTNGGTSWSNIEGDLPDMPVNWGIFVPSPDKRIALATAVGVWTTSSAAGSGTGTAWMPDNNGMANVSTDMLKFRKSDSTIAAATHGRGVFTTNLATTLPLKLTSFTGSLQNQHGILNWRTSSESNTSHFEIQKSFDGQRYSKIGSVKAAGNSSSTREYGFSDKEQAQAVNYYRLKMIDNDGKYTYSNTVLLRNASARQSPTVLNNPFNNHLDIRFPKLPAGEVNIQLANGNGTIIQSQRLPSISQNLYRFNIARSASLSKGVYVLTIYNNKEKYSISVIKE